MEETTKKAPASTAKAKTAAAADKAAKNKTEEQFTRAEVEQMIADALAKQQQPQIIQLQADVEKVFFLFQAEVADDNVCLFGDGGMYGRVVGKTGTFYVPKPDLSRILDERTRWMMDNRWLIVLSGLDDSERESLNCAYRDGELLDKNAFAKMVELGDKMLDIFPALCSEHKRMVAQRYADAYPNAKITRELVVKLNDMSKEDGKGMFTSLIELMNAADAN